ncbi:hypothetical protein XI07_05120 [Bradyrhizobium sp. CCBAU 11445]|nr:hypothetical protein [Bradyrhizobium sp. CCBAU 11445]MDA9521876.1 hypothetical protein [Bradyrhizobium sp. CCBAU 11434]
MVEDAATGERLLIYGTDEGIRVPVTSAGCRVSFAQAALVRKWATEMLVEFATKEFVIDAKWSSSLIRRKPISRTGLHLHVRKVSEQRIFQHQSPRKTSLLVAIFTSRIAARTRGAFVRGPCSRQNFTPSRLQGLPLAVLEGV